MVRLLRGEEVIEATLGRAIAGVSVFKLMSDLLPQRGQGRGAREVVVLMDPGLGVFCNEKPESGVSLPSKASAHLRAQGGAVPVPRGVSLDAAVDAAMLAGVGDIAARRRVVARAGCACVVLSLAIPGEVSIVTLAPGAALRLLEVAPHQDRAPRECEPSQRLVGLFNALDDQSEEGCLLALEPARDWLDPVGSDYRA